MYQPFAYMAAAGGGGGGFDPTLGGAISPYFWYDFTDSSTMTLSGTDVTTIASKGSNTGTLAPGTTGTKYTSAYVAPTFNTTHTTFNGNGTSTNSVMARRYGSGTYNTDGNFGADTSNTTIWFGQPNWVSSSWTNWVVSWKGPTTAAGSQPEEWSPVMFFNGAYYPGTIYQATGGASSNNTTVSTVANNSGNKIGNWSYNGASNITGTQLDNYHSQVVRNTSNGGGVGADEEAGRSIGELTTTYQGPRDTLGNSQNEGLAIGGRARSDVSYGTNFNIKHYVMYESALTDSEITDVISSYEAAYPGDNLNT